MVNDTSITYFLAKSKKNKSSGKCFKTKVRKSQNFLDSGGLRRIVRHICLFITKKNRRGISGNIVNTFFDLFNIRNMSWGISWDVLNFYVMGNARDPIVCDGQSSIGPLI